MKALILRFVLCLSACLIVISCTRQREFKDSGVAAGLLPDTLLLAAAQGHVVRVGGGGASFGGGVYRVELKKEATFEVNDGSEDKFMKAFRRAVEALIESKGGSIEGRGQRTASGELTGFQVDYRWTGNQGIIRIHSLREANRIQINVLCYEHRR